MKSVKYDIRISERISVYDGISEACSTRLRMSIIGRTDIFIIRQYHRVFNIPLAFGS